MSIIFRFVLFYFFFRSFLFSRPRNNYDFRANFFFFFRGMEIPCCLTEHIFLDGKHF